MKLHIVDANNWIRKVYEKDSTGLPLRNLFAMANDTTDPMIYVFDGKGAKAPRRAIFPDYKEGRTPAPDAFYTTLELMKLLVTKTNKLMICVPGYEADDVIAHIVGGRKPTDPPIEIRSNDADYLALLCEGVTVTEPSTKFKDVAYRDVRLYKTLCGDGSDNISGIKGFAGGTFAKLTEEQKNTWIGLLTGYDDTLILDDLEKELGLKKAQVIWVRENFALLKAFWQVVGFIPMTDALIALHTVVGNSSRIEAEAILGTVFQ